MYTCGLTCVCMRESVCMHVCACTCVYARVCIMHACVCTCVYVHVCESMYVCVESSLASLSSGNFFPFFNCKRLFLSVICDFVFVSHFIFFHELLKAKQRKKEEEGTSSFFHNFTVCSGRIWIPEPHQQQSSWEKLSFNTFYLSVARNGLEVFQIEYVIWFPKDIQFFIYTFYSKNQRYTCIFIHLLLFAFFFLHPITLQIYIYFCCLD